MSNEIEYILIVALVAIMSLTVGGIGYSSKCRTDAAETEGEKLAVAFATLRDNAVSDAVERLLTYIEQERHFQPQLTVLDVLAHGSPTEELKALERVGEKRAKLRNLAAQIKTFANISRHMFIIPLLGFPSIFIPLSLHLEFANTVWYIAWGFTTFAFGTAGLGSLYIFHNKRVALEERLSKLKLDGAQ